MGQERKSHPDCVNASNPYHECVENCLKKIVEAKEQIQGSEESKDNSDVPEERIVHPDCVNALNPYHECSEFCFKRIAEEKNLAGTAKSETQDRDGSNQSNIRHEESEDQADQTNGDGDNAVHEDDTTGYPQLNERQKKLFELRLKMNEARKANQMALVAEKKRLEAPSESRGVSKQKWLEDRQKRIGKLLDANGLEMSKAYMLDTQETAEAKYKKWEKDPAPFGGEVFNQKTLYNAYKKRTKNMEVDMEAYKKAKEEDPEFYRDASSLQYGKAPKIPEENIDRMVKELQEREEKRKQFSRRRRFHDDKDIDSINDRNEHFNKKIERAFGKYTLEIKNNLERGTALPD